jgi:hypothetical protein
MQETKLAPRTSISTRKWVSISVGLEFGGRPKQENPRHENYGTGMIFPKASFDKMR